MRVILISDSRDYMARLRHMLARFDANVEVTEYDPRQHGRPGPHFDWETYDLLVLEELLAGTESGLEWLAGFALAGKLPATVLVASHLDRFIAGKVARMSNTEYVLREAFDDAALGDLLRRLGVPRAAAARPVTLANLKFKHDSDIVRELASNLGDLADDGYKFVRLIGQGAQSRVYLAERIADQQTMVLKILDLDSIEDTSSIRRFQREAELLASIDSPHVIRFFGHGFTPSYGYIAVEFFTRGDLRQRIDHGINSADALLYGLHIAYGLAAIHDHGIVHRDVKPGNIMFRSDDSVALADFGISKHLDDTWGLTRTGAVIGTLSYLSPEQGLGQPIDHRTDLYAWGMVLFEMLTGAKAFRGNSPGALVYQHLYADIPTLPEHLGAYQVMIDRTLAKDPDHRYQSAAELIAELTPHCA